MIKAVDLACAMARRFEALRLHPYLDAIGVPTIGYGATYYQNGVHVTLKDPPLTKEQAEALLIWMVETKYMPSVLSLCQKLDTPQRIAAIHDFTFNLGENNLKNSTLRRRINAGRWEDVPAEIRKWNRAGGRVLSGLTFRRNAEAVLI